MITIIKEKYFTKTLRKKHKINFKLAKRKIATNTI